MATVADGRATLQLYSGDRMSRAEFHRAYALAPKTFRAELIGGVVFVASPVGRDHGLYQALLVTLFTSYAFRTPGVEAGDNTTIILGDDTEPQPDVHIRTIEECGGHSHTTSDGYVEGPPEFVAEVSHSSRAIDLHSKYETYARFGVQEYFVLCLDERKIRWFDLQNNQDLTPDRPAVISSNSFPGLRIDGGALLDQNYHRLVATLEEGIASPEHRAFLKQLEARRASR